MNPKPGLPRDAAAALDLLGGYINNFYPGCRLKFDVFDLVDTMDGFAVFSDGGLSMFFVDATQAPQNGGQWNLQMGTVLAADIPDVSSALLWSNANNRRSSLDRYYCAITPDGSKCAVAAETDVSSFLLKDFGHSIAVLEAVKGLAKNTLFTASSDSRDLLSTCAGRALGPRAEDLMLLFTVLGG